MKFKLKPPMATESEITRQIRFHLRIKDIPHWKEFGTLGSEKGIPDLIGVLPGGRILAIEVKTERGQVSEYQQAWMDRINRTGGLAFVARSVFDVIDRLG